MIRPWCSPVGHQMGTKTWINGRVGHGKIVRTLFPSASYRCRLIRFWNISIFQLETILSFPTFWCIHSCIFLKSLKGQKRWQFIKGSRPYIRVHPTVDNILRQKLQNGTDLTIERWIPIMNFLLHYWPWDQNEISCRDVFVFANNRNKNSKWRSFGIIFFRFYGLIVSKKK